MKGSQHDSYRECWLTSSCSEQIRCWQNRGGALPQYCRAVVSHSRQSLLAFRTSRHSSKRRDVFEKAPCLLSELWAGNGPQQTKQHPTRWKPVRVFERCMFSSGGNLKGRADISQSEMQTESLNTKCTLQAVIGLT